MLQRKNRGTRRRLVAALGTATAVALATCGVDVAATAPAGAASNSSSGPIVVGGIYASFNFPGMQAGFQARVNRFNKAGGIDGRKIQFIGVTDDQDSPSSEQTALQQLIQNKHVFAVAPFADDVLASTSIFSENQTPVIGYGVSQAWCNNKWTISVVGCQQSTAGWETTSSIRQIIKASGKPAKDLRVAMEGYDSPPAVFVSKTLAEVWQKLGAKVVFNQNQVPLTGTTNQQPFVQGMMASNPNIAFEVTGSAAAISLSAALKSGGYKGLIYNGASYVPSELKSQPSVAQALNGVYVTTLLPSGYDGTPAIKQEVKDLKAIGKPADIEIGTSIGYWSADLLIQLLQATKARGAALTPANLAQTVAKGVTVKPSMTGGNGPLAWPKMANQPQPCTSTVRGAGTTYKLSQKFTCYPNTKVALPSSS